MIVKRENRMKELALEIIESGYVDIVPTKGLSFDDYSITYDGRYSHILDHEDYPIIRRKLKSVIKLVNETPELIHKDFETELWPMVAKSKRRR